MDGWTHVCVCVSVCVCVHAWNALQCSACIHPSIHAFIDPSKHDFSIAFRDDTLHYVSVCIVFLLHSITIMLM